jgi:hypothetical protein
MKRLVLLFACLFLFSALAFSSGGASGVFSGLVQPEWDPNFLGLPLEAVHQPFNLAYVGGFSYEVDDEGSILGYFGMAFMDKGFFTGGEEDSHMAGGAFGLVVGQRVIGTDFLHLDLASRLGLGGCYVNEWLGAASPRDPTGYMILYAEPYAELGIGIFPWAHLAVTAGYQIMGNWLPGLPFQHLFTLTPTIGLSVSFGSFYF